MELQSFMDWVCRRNPGEPEFQQAVREIAEDVVPFVNEHPQYERARVLERMTEPDRIIVFRVCWQDDQGDVQVNRGYRVQFNKAIGPYKGGLRFDPSVNLSILKFLGFEQTFKNSLTTLHMGGGKGGADFDPKGKSHSEVMRFCQSFMTELARHIGDRRDVPAGDIGVGAREIGFLFGQYKRLANEFSGVLTGKQIEYGGSQIRTEATGYGAVYLACDALLHHGMSVENQTCVISGSGNVAQYAAQKLVELGAKVVTVSDRSGYVHAPDGLGQEDVDALIALKNVRREGLGVLAEERGFQFYEGKKPWGVPCDLAFPCATQNEIAEDDARELISNGCKLVSEGANMPTMIEGVHAFQEASTLFLPGKAANAGGVAVSGLEMSQNAMRHSRSREDVDRELRAIMKHIHGKCVEYGASGARVDYVRGANLAGFVKVADAMLAHGVI
jgi:glutamate dehydrogenase (NADP+)